MSVYVLIPLFLFIFAGGLLFLVIINGIANLSRKLFAIFLGCMTLWGFFIALMRSSNTLDEAYSWERYVLISITSVGFVFYLFVLQRTQAKERKPLKYFITALYIISLVFVPTDLAVKGMQALWYGKAPIIGPLFPIYVFAIYVPIVRSLTILVRHYRTSRILDEKIRDSYLILGISIMLLGGTTDYLPALGLEIYPLGIIGNLLFCSLATLAMLRHGLMEIRVVLRRATSYSLVSLLMLGIVFGLYLVFASINKDLDTPVFISILSIGLVAIAIVFHPLQTKVQRVVDKMFFGDRYDYMRSLEVFSGEAKNVIELKQLADSLISRIGYGMGSKKVYLLLPSPRSGDYETFISFCQTDDTCEEIKLSAESEVVRVMKYREGAVDIRDTIDFLPSADPEHKENKMLLREGIELLVPLMSKKVLTGILLMANKISGETYSSEERQLLTTISNQAAVSIENARLYAQLQDQLIKSAKLASLGEMATNVAHEVNNSLQAILNYGSILYEDLDETSPMKEDAKVLQSEAIRARNIVEILLGIARKERTIREAVDINNVIKSVLTLVRLRTKTQDIIIEEKYSMEAMLVMASMEQMTQVFLNLFVNATDAMENKGTLKVETAVDGKEAVFVITDTGPGMPPKMIDQIFQPLFTTKPSGTGLGLTVVKSIVEEHGGAISVDSETGKGTSFKIRLPRI